MGVKNVRFGGIDEKTHSTNVSFLLLLNFSVNQKSQWNGSLEEENGVKIIRNPNGEVEKKLAEIPFSFNRITLKKGRTGSAGYSQSLFMTHGYEHDVFILKIDGDTLIYGYSEQYERTGEELVKRFIIKNWD